MRLRHTYVASVLVQDQVFFDLVGPGEIAARTGKDISSIRTGLGEKIAFVVWSLSTLLTGLISVFSMITVYAFRVITSLHGRHLKSYCNDPRLIKIQLLAASITALASCYIVNRVIRHYSLGNINGDLVSL